MNRKEAVQLFKMSFKDWQSDNAALRAGALTFFIILPLPSLLLIIVTIFGQFYGQAQAVQQLTAQISAIAGPAVADLFNQLLQGATSPFTSVWSAVTVVAFSLIGAIGAFAVLRDIMDVIWEVKVPKKKKLTERLKQTIRPFVLVSFLGLIVIAWTLFATSLFNAIRLYSINGTLTLISLSAAQIGLSFVLSSLLFAIIYKEIPQKIIHWADVGVAAIVTGIAFTATNYIFGLYIQTFTITTIIGAAGALLIILLWIFILNQIVLFGAEMSKVYTLSLGPHPNEHMPLLAERFVLPLERAGEKIEIATKGNFIEATVTSNTQPVQELQPQSQEAAKKTEVELPKQQTIEIKQVGVETKSEPEKPDKDTIEV